jgi:hypothetical protein
MTARTSLLVPLGILLAAPTPASAQKYTKKTFDMQSVSVPARAAPQPAAKAEIKAGPSMTLEQFTRWKQGNVLRIIDKQIAYLRNLIALASPDDPNLPDYYFRLAELFSEKYRYFTHRARSLDEEIYRAEHPDGQSDDAGEAEPQRREQESDQHKADLSLRAAVSQYVVAAKHPRYRRMDEVLCRLGYLLGVAGRSEQSRAVFHRLLKEHPQSRFVPHAYLAFADDFRSEARAHT